MANVNDFIAKAKQAGFSDEQINAYVQAKTAPVAPVQPTVTPQVTAQPQKGGNLLTDILGAVTKPADDYRKLAGEGLVSLLRLGGAGVNKLTGGDFAGEKRGLIGAPITGQEKPIFMDQETAQKYNTPEGAAIQGGKTLAGGLSYVVPFGRGASLATKALIPGAISAGLFETSREGATPESVAQSAVVGGATAGVLQKALPWLFGKIGGASKGAGEAMATDVLNPQVKPSPFYSTEVSQMSKAAQDLGLKGSAQGQLEQMPTIWNKLETAIKTKLANITEPVKKSVWTANYTDELANSNYIKGDKVWDAAKSSLDDLVAKKLGSNPTASALYALKSELRGQLTKVFEKEGMTTLAPKEEVKLALYKSLKTTLDGLDESIRPLNAMEHQLFEMAPGLVKNAQKGVQLPFVGTRLPVQRPLQALESVLGQGATSLGQKATGVSEALQTPLMQYLAGQTAGRIGSNVGGVSEQPTVMPETQVQTETPTSDVTKMALDKLRSLKGEANRQITPEQMQAVMLSKNISNATKTRIKAAYDIQEETIKQNMTNAKVDRTKAADAESGLKLLDVIQNQYKVVQSQGLTANQPGLGRLAGLKGEAAAITQDNPDAAAYKQTIDAFMSKLSRASGEKGVLTDKDIARIQKAVPGFYDTPETAAKKFELIRQIMSSAINSAVAE